jgi:hypothetical protein
MLPICISYNAFVPMIPIVPMVSLWAWFALQLIPMAINKHEE